MAESRSANRKVQVMFKFLLAPHQSKTVTWPGPELEWADKATFPRVLLRGGLKNGSSTQSFHHPVDLDQLGHMPKVANCWKPGFRRDLSDSVTCLSMAREDKESVMCQAANLHVS